MTIEKREVANQVEVRLMPFDRGKVNCFTDGSKSNVGTGNAYKIYSHEFSKGESRYLGETATVFQAEVAAITAACQAMLEEKVEGKEINFYVDSQSALDAVGSYMSRSRCVWECRIS